jgi:hypothetical protein
MTSKSSVSKKSSFALAIFAFFLFGLGGTAWAKKRVVVTRFAGKGDHAQRTATDVVARNATVISDATWTRAMKKLKLRSTSSPDAATRVAAAVQADGIVAGSVQRSGKAWSLTITVVDGKTGQVSDTLDIPLRSYRLDGDSKKAIAAQLAPAIARLGNKAPIEIAPEPTRPPLPPPPPKVPEIDTEKPPIGVEAPPTIDTTATTAPVTTVTAEASEDGRYSRSRAAEISVGVGIIGRNLEFDATSGLSAAQAPRGYSGSAVPTVVVEGELYPFAFGGSTSAASCFGIGFEVERVLSISSQLGATEYDTSQTRYGGGLRYRANFGSSAMSPSLKFVAGISRLDFTVERGSADLAFPNSAYTYVDLGLKARLPLGSPKFAVYLDLRYLQVLDAGEMNDTAFYGSGGALGFDGGIGLEYIFARRAVVRLGGRYQRFALSFDGNGTLSNNRDGNSATQEVSGATDQFYGGYLTVGYMF